MTKQIKNEQKEQENNKNYKFEHITAQEPQIKKSITKLLRSSDPQPENQPQKTKPQELIAHSCSPNLKTLLENQRLHLPCSPKPQEPPFTNISRN